MYTSIQYSNTIRFINWIGVGEGEEETHYNCRAKSLDYIIKFIKILGSLILRSLNLRLTLIFCICFTGR